MRTRTHFSYLEGQCQAIVNYLAGQGPPPLEGMPRIPDPAHRTDLENQLKRVKAKNPKLRFSLPAHLR
jgi:hypothetical protein